MNIVFFGTSEFAVESLRALLASGHTVSLVVTQPDAKKGRRLVMSPPPVKVLAESHGIRVYQPADASSAQAVDFIRAVHPDLFVVIAYGQILKPEMLSVPRLYAINLHGSLLPLYRGAAPTNRAVMNGDSSTGVTIIRLNERMDAGDIMAQERIPIGEDDTNITVSESLASTGARLLVEMIDRVSSGAEITFTPQDGSRATIARKLRKEEGLIDWHESAVTTHNKVRGLLPWPGAYTYIGDKMLKILRTRIVPSPSTSEPGTVVDIVKGAGLIISTGSGDIAITDVQLEAGKAMSVEAFLRGHPLLKGDRFSSSRIA